MTIRRLEQCESFLDIEVRILEEYLALLFNRHLSTQDLVPERRIELPGVLGEHLRVRFLILQVLRFAGLQLLLALLGLGNEGVAEFGVLETTFLLLIKVLKEEVQLVH